MEILKKGFYWSKNRYGSDHFVYYTGNSPSDDRISVSHFNERGMSGNFWSSIDRLIPFNAEEDMKKLNPKTVERVKQKLEELAREKPY